MIEKLRQMFTFNPDTEIFLREQDGAYHTALLALAVIARLIFDNIVRIELQLWAVQDDPRGERLVVKPIVVNTPINNNSTWFTVLAADFLPHNVDLDYDYV